MNHILPGEFTLQAQTPRGGTRQVERDLGGIPSDVADGDEMSPNFQPSTEVVLHVECLFFRKTDQRGRRRGE